MSFILLLIIFIIILFLLAGVAVGALPDEMARDACVLFFNFFTFFFNFFTGTLLLIVGICRFVQVVLKD